MLAEQLQGSRMSHMLPARSTDDKEITDHPGLTGQPADESKPGQSRAAENQVSTPVRIIEVSRQPTELVQSFVIGHRPPEL